MEKVKEKYEVAKQQSEDLQIILQKILQTINRQVMGLASTIGFYNIHLLLHNPQEKSFTITIGGLQ
jgi:hypothetical protein